MAQMLQSVFKGGVGKEQAPNVFSLLACAIRSVLIVTKMAHTSILFSLQTSASLCNGMMTKTKSRCLADAILENSDNPRRLWSSINIILHKIPPTALPEFTSVKSFCDHISKYFVDKIENIRSR